MSIVIAKTKASHQQYDMCDVFTVVFPLSEGSRTLEDKFLDLYTQYDKITEEEVAASCEWYNKWTAKEYYHDNLTLTFKHLENNMTHKLFDKCFERYDTYPPIQQGGPLLFIIMMKTLVSSSEQATQHLVSYNQLMEYLEDKTETGPLEDGLYRFKCIKDHKGPYTSSEVDLGGHDPNPNHVNESLLSEVVWGAHNSDADDPEQLTGESIQSFLTFVVQLQWLVALGRLVTHAQACGGIILISRPTFMDIYPYFQDNTSFKFPSSHTHTHTHTNYIYIYILLCMSAQQHVTSTSRGERQNCDIWHTSGCLMVDVPYLDHLWDGQKNCLDVGQVRCFHEETSRKLLSWKEDTKESDRIPAKKSLV